MKLNPASWSRIASKCAMTALLPLMVLSCGGGGSGGSTGTEKDSGPQMTQLRVEATDLEGDTLSYQWRVTAGSIINRNAPGTVWTLPAGPGLHFAYVRVSDAKGGYVEQQYAVATDTLNISLPPQKPVSNPVPTVAAADEFPGATFRLRLFSAESSDFSTANGERLRRQIYLPDINVRLLQQDSGEQVFAGVTDLSGEIVLPKLPEGKLYELRCTTAQSVPLAGCPTVLSATSESATLTSAVQVGGSAPEQRNLRLFGHVGLADGAVCGAQNEYFGLQSNATVQLQQDDGSTLGPAQRVNRFGDYALDAAVPIKAKLKLKVVCESHSAVVDVPALEAGYFASTPVEASYVIPNTRPRVLKMVANGPEGSVRGKMVEAVDSSFSIGLPGPDLFLTYKGRDTRLSACLYYKSLGAVKDCDPQGNFTGAIKLDDWKRQHKLAPFDAGNEQVAATYINQRDLNLVRKMTATRLAADHIAFSVCNHPGPDGKTQAETDAVIDTALADEKRVACVTMEYSVTPGRNGNKPFTKFFTFGPDGSLIASINLDQRGEKYLPGACVACHGGLQYAGRFPDKGNPSPDVRATFLPFDTGNYLFSSHTGLSEEEQGAAFRKLNDLVLATNPTTATKNLVAGWYKGSSNILDKQYVPPAWASFNPASLGIDATPADAAVFYRSVVGSSCRTCHTAMSDRFDWDGGEAFPRLTQLYRGSPHICGGGADVANNATMPNALMSRDGLQDNAKADAALASLMQKFLGCSEPLADPAYPKR